MGMKLEGHFWFSKTQKDIIRKQDYQARPVFCIIDGKVLEHTTWNSTSEHGCKHDDMVYLGYGKYSHAGNEGA